MNPGSNLVLRALGIVGMLLFGAGLAVTFASPVWVERAAAGFLQSQLQAQLRERVGFDGVDGSGAIAGLALRLQRENREAIEQVRQRLASGMNQRIADVVARMQDLDCECRQRMKQGLDLGARLQIASLERAEPQLRRLIEGGYGAIVAELLRDLRIFTGTNLLAFAAVFVLSFRHPQRSRQLFVPALLLALASLVASAVYLFGQNWFFTLLYDDFMGFAYAGWLLLIYGLLCDVALFRARVTSWLADLLFSALGKAAAAPC